MSFVGPVSRVGERLVRPHDIDVLLDPAEGALEGVVARVLHLGFEVRLEVRLADGRTLGVQQARAQAEELDVQPGGTVFLRPRRVSEFAPLAR